MDWRAWHEDYADPESAHARRLVVVQAQIGAALDRALEARKLRPRSP